MDSLNTDAFSIYTKGEWYIISGLMNVLINQIVSQLMLFDLVLSSNS